MVRATQKASHRSLRISSACHSLDPRAVGDIDWSSRRALRSRSIRCRAGRPVCGHRKNHRGARQESQRICLKRQTRLTFATASSRSAGPTGHHTDRGARRPIRLPALARDVDIACFGERIILPRPDLPMAAYCRVEIDPETVYCRVIHYTVSNDVGVA